MPSLNATLRIVLASAFLAGCAHRAPNLPDQPSHRLPAPRVIDLSLWPDRDSLTSALRTTSAPVVAFDGETLDVLPGCTLAGTFVTHPIAPDSVRSPTTRLFTTQEDLDAAFPLHDATIVVKAGLPIAVTAIFSKQWDLATLERNELPASDACARATHVVIGVRFGTSTWRRHEQGSLLLIATGGLLHDINALELVRDQHLEEDTSARCTGPHADCEQPLVVVLIPIGPSRAIEAATLVHLQPIHGETWSATLDDATVCRLPCDRWIMPHTALTMQRPGGEKVGLIDDFPGVPERDVVMSRVKDPLYPWLGLGMMPFGAGLTGLTIALATGSVSPSQRSISSGAGGSIGGAVGESAKDLAGIAVLGLLGVILDGFSLYYLVKGPDLVPTFRVEAPGTKARSGARKSGKSNGFSVSPTGVGVRF